MRNHHDECVLVTTAAPDFVDITDEVEAALARSGIREGQVTLFSPHDECSLLVQERESGLLLDIERTLARLGASGAPPRALIGSPSVVLPAAMGRLRLGAWQRVMLVELTEPSARSVLVHVVGE
jgi:thiamine phosphate synthase YjbQ (UPF0047 family)